MKTNKKLVVNLIEGFGLSLIVVGSLFRIQHWPYGTVYVCTGVSVYIIALLAKYFADKDDRRADHSTEA